MLKLEKRRIFCDGAMWLREKTSPGKNMNLALPLDWSQRHQHVEASQIGPDNEDISWLSQLGPGIRRIRIVADPRSFRCFVGTEVCARRKIADREHNFRSSQLFAFPA